MGRKKKEDSKEIESKKKKGSKGKKQELEKITFSKKEDIFSLKFNHYDPEIYVAYYILNFVDSSFDLSYYYIFGLGEALDFRLDPKSKIPLIYPRIPSGELLKNFFKNTEIKYEIIEIDDIEKDFNNNKEKYLYICNYPSKEEINGDFVTYIIIKNISENQIDIMVNTEKKGLKIEFDKFIENFKSLKEKGFIYKIPKKNKKLTLNKILKIHNDILINVADRMYFSKNEYSGIKAMHKVDEYLKDAVEDFDKFTLFADNFIKYWDNKYTDGAGFRNEFYNFLNVLIKVVEDPTGDIKCTHEIYKVIRERWKIFIELIKDASLSPHDLEEKKDEILQRFHFNAIESEELAMSFLAEMGNLHKKYGLE